MTRWAEVARGLLGGNEFLCVLGLLFSHVQFAEEFVQTADHCVERAVGEPRFTRTEIVVALRHEFALDDVRAGQDSEPFADILAVRKVSDDASDGLWHHVKAFDGMDVHLHPFIGHHCPRFPDEAPVIEDEMFISLCPHGHGGFAKNLDDDALQAVMGQRLFLESTGGSTHGVTSKKSDKATELTKRSCNFH